MFGQSLSLADNPIIRSADTLNGMFYGALDLLSGHLLNYIFNEELDLGIKYFTQSPTNTRGVVADISMGAFILAARP